MERRWAGRGWWPTWLAAVALVLVAGGGRRADGAAGNVTYDGRSLIINGQRKVLFSGSIHYPRSTPDMWPSLIARAKQGGIDVIQTYVFWNLHEPQHQKVGLLGEKLKIYTGDGSIRVQWSSYKSSSSQRLNWYKTMFDAPAGDDPLALNMISMGKGEVWVNGQSIGRYWISFRTEQGNPSQQWYHILRSFLKPTGNLLVMLEEQTRYSLNITLDIVTKRLAIVERRGRENIRGKRVVTPNTRFLRLYKLPFIDKLSNTSSGRFRERILNSICKPEHCFVHRNIRI